MRKVICILVILMMTVGVFAETPVLISALPFGLEQDGDNFTIIVDENPTTGYSWEYVVKDTDHVKFIEDNYKSESDLIGAGGQHRYSFKVLKDGVSTIKFSYKRPFEESPIKEFVVLVYKNGEKVFVEEDQIVTINEPVMTEVKTESKLIQNVYMIPVSALESLGYEVKFDEEKEVVEIHKGAQWTSVTLGKNAYFKNRMAASPLSAAPVLVKGEVYVPVEFVTHILDLGIQVDGKTVTINMHSNGKYTGLVKEIVSTSRGVSLHIVFDNTSEMTDVVLHLSLNNTYVQKYIQVGDRINAITSMATTMSIPPQTAAYIIY